MASEFEELGASRVGISADQVDRQRRFDDLNGLGFPLLSDPGREVHQQFGTRRVAPWPAKRATFVIAQDRRLVRSIRNETNMLTHADDALDALRNLAG